MDHVHGTLRVGGSRSTLGTVHSFRDIQRLEQTSSERWKTQFNTLLWKQLLVVRRSPIFLFLSLFGPFLTVIIAATVYSSLSQDLQDRIASTKDNSNLVRLEIPTGCSGGGSAEFCKPIIYYTPDDAYNRAIMDKLVQNVGLDKTLIVAFASEQDMISAMYENSRKLQKRRMWAGVIFTTLSRRYSKLSDALNDQRTKTTSYSIVDGLSLIRDNAIPRQYRITKPSLLALKIELDSAIMSVLKQDPSPSIKTNIAGFAQYTKRAASSFIEQLTNKIAEE